MSAIYQIVVTTTNSSVLVTVTTVNRVSVVTAGPQGPRGDDGAEGPPGPAGPLAGSTGQLIYNNGGSAAGADVGSDLDLSLGVLSLSVSGATSGSYGTGTSIPVISIDSKGRITSASTTTIDPFSTVGKDVLWDAQATVIYRGTAPTGSNQSAAVWNIRRAVFTSSGVLTSEGSATGAWTNRTSLTYT
jgi:hypothetical protein